jgi:hypothetical protein
VVDSGSLRVCDNIMPLSDTPIPNMPRVPLSLLIPGLTRRQILEGAGRRQVSNRTANSLWRIERENAIAISLVEIYTYVCGDPF